MIDAILADYAIPATDANRAGVESLVATRGEDAARRLLTSIHGRPDEIAAGNPRRVVSGGPARNANAVNRMGSAR